LDLKRHKEILHKRFKIYDCPHCNDKFCSQEDMERHLAKVEKNNRVEGITKKISIAVKKTTEAVKKPPKPVREEENATEPETETLEEVAEATKENQNSAETIVKKMEEKTFRCSDCGMKTPSRMTYIQHVLNGCIMDMVQDQDKKEDVIINPDGTVTPKAKRGRPKGSLNKNKRVKLDEEHDKVEG